MLPDIHGRPGFYKKNSRSSSPEKKYVFAAAHIDPPDFLADFISFWEISIYFKFSQKRQNSELEISPVSGFRSYVVHVRHVRVRLGTTYYTLYTPRTTSSRDFRHNFFDNTHSRSNNVLVAITTSGNNVIRIELIESDCIQEFNYAKRNGVH